VSPRRRFPVLALLAIASLGAAASCSAPTSPDTPAGTSIPVAHVTSPALSFPTTFFEQPAGQIMIADATSWRVFWTNRTATTRSSPPVPDIDFSTYAVLITSMGPRPNGGYFTFVKSVTTGTFGRLVIAITEVSPGSDCGVGELVTQPVDAILVPRALARVVEYDVTPSIAHCS
jgi:hypothetical protein